MTHSLPAFCLCFLLLSLFCGISPCQARSLDHKTYHVIRVIDGDTIQLDHQLHVRLIGIDTPEVKYGPKFQRDLQDRHLSKRTELRMGRLSYQFTKHLILGKSVRLEFDKQRYDNYHRLLAYVYLTNGIFVNAEIVRAGYAYDYPIKPDLHYAELFRHLYKDAQDQHRGLWKNEEKFQKKFKWFDR